MLNLPWSKRFALGLNIQPGYLYLMKVAKTYKSIQPSFWFSQKIDQDIFDGHKIVKWEKLASLLAELTQRYDLEKQSIAIQIPAQLVRMQLIQLPQGMTKLEIHQEAKQRYQSISGMTHEFCVDFHVQPGKQASMDVRYVASEANYLNQYMECLTQAGLIVKLITVDVLLLWQLAKLSHLDLKNLDLKNFSPIIITVSQLSTAIYIFDDGILSVTQKWHVASEHDFLAQLEAMLLKHCKNKQREIHLFRAEDENDSILQHSSPHENLKLITHDVRNDLQCIGINTTFFHDALGFSLSYALALRMLNL